MKWTRQATTHLTKKTGTMARAGAAAIAERLARNLWPGGSGSSGKTISQKPHAGKKAASKTKRKTSKSQTVQGHQNATGKTVGLGRGKPKRVKASYRMQISYKDVMTSIAGQQGLGDMFAMLTKAQINTNTGAAYNNFQGFQGLRSINPNQQTTGSGLYAARSPLNENFWVRRIHFHIDMTNLESNATRILIHIHKCIKDTSSTPAALINVSIGTTYEGQGLNVGAQNAPGIGIGNGGAATINIPGIEPYDGANLKKYFKHVHSREVLLGAGATEKMSYFINSPKKISVEEVNTTSVEWMKGYTYHVTFQILAQVGLDVTGGVRIPTYVRSEVAWVAQVFYEMAECKVNTRMLTRYVSENIPTGTTGANLRTINEVDVVQTEQEV